MAIRAFSFLTPGNFPDDDPWVGLEETLQLFEYGEQLGYDGAWIRQRHLEHGVSSGAGPVELPPELAREAPGGDSVDPNNPILANYGDNSLKVRLRAHPEVAARHHADLLASGQWTH